MTQWILLAAALGGCSKIKDVAFVPGQIPGSGSVTFEGGKDGDATVKFGLADGELDQETPPAPAADGKVEVRGLKSGKSYQMVVVTDKGESEPIDVTIDPPASGVPAFTLNAWQPEKSCMDGGYVLFSYIGADKSGVAILDRDGNYVWSLGVDEPAQVGRVRPGRDGQSILYNTADAAKVDDIAQVIRVSYDGTVQSVTETLNGHHDFVERSDGRIAWLGYEFRDGIDPAGDDPDLGPVCVAADVIYESDEGLSDRAGATEIWNTWTDYPAGVYTIPPDSMVIQRDNDGNIIKIEPAFLKERGCYEFGHGNSLAYRDSDGGYLMNWRWLDVTMKIDGASGDLAWEWGGAFAELPGAADEAFEHGHFSDVWDGGMLMFDNRNRAELSRLVEYAFDDAGYQEVWSYESDKFENLLGDVRRIPIEGCDNLLVSWSGQGRMSEITRDGELVWDVGATAVGNVTSRVFFVPDLYDMSGVAYPD
ncbi:MAG: hypothetical protein ABMB14_23615 [Myxococcota bacterium]